MNLPDALFVLAVLAAISGAASPEVVADENSQVARECATGRNRPPRDAGQGEATVTGIVLLDGDPPAPIVVDLEDDMQEITGNKTLAIQPWAVGTNKGLADCVMTLSDPGGAPGAAVEPLERAALHKDGPSFVPRVQVVTAGTTLVYRNKNSPCRCFNVSGRHARANPLVAAGEQFTLVFDKRDLCRVVSNNRAYMLAWIHVVDTPYYALSDAEGRFEITGVPPGHYRVRIWHEGAGRIGADAGPMEITVAAGKVPSLTYRVTVPDSSEAPPP